MIAVEGANGQLQIGDRIAYPSKGGQRLATIVRIRVTASYDWGQPVERVTILVHPDDANRWDRVCLRNPKNIVKVAQ